MLAVSRSAEPSEVLADPAAAARVADEWRALAARVPGTSYFVTPDWALGWWETLGRGVPGEVAVWRGPGGRAEAVAALVRTRDRLHPRVPVRVTAWVNMGSGPGAADHCGWPVLAGRAPHVRRWLAERAADAPLLLRELDPSMTALVPEGARRVGASPCPRLAVPEAGEAVGASARFRKRLRSYGRRLRDAGVRFRWVPPEEVDAEVLRLVFDLHLRRQSLKDGGTTFDLSREPFHRALVARAGPGRGPAVVLAEAGGEAVGALYGFLWGGVFAYYQSGWDPRWASESLGTALVAEAVRLAGRAGADTFDFLRGAEEYKYRFGAADRVDGTWLVPTGLPGRLLELKHRARSARTKG